MTCAWSSQQLEQLIRQHTRILPPTVTNLNLHSDGTVDVVRVMGPQLRHLHLGLYFTTLHSFPVGVLRQLTHISLPDLSDLAMDLLVTVPTLTHVTVSNVLLDRDHTSKQPQWQQLKITGEADLDKLQLLPLHLFKQLVIHSIIRCRPCPSGNADVIQQATANFVSCPNLQCVPGVQDLPGQPEFTLLMTHPDKLVPLVVNSMTANASLYLKGIQFTGLQQVLPCLSQLPEKVDMLHLWFHMFDPDRQQLTSEQRVQIMQQLTGALPPHVKRLVIDHHTDFRDETKTDDLCAYVIAIIHHLRVSQQPVQVVVVEQSLHLQTVPAKIQVLVDAYCDGW